MADFNLTQFNSMAAHSRRAVLIDRNGELTRSSIGRHSLSQAHKLENSQVMEAFHTALKENFGIFGDQAFAHVMTRRASMQKSLRMRDIKQVLAEAEGSTRFVSLAGEGTRLLAIHPKYMDLAATPGPRRQIMNDFKKLMENFKKGEPLPESLQDVEANRKFWTDKLSQAKSIEELSPLAERLLDAATEKFAGGVKPSEPDLASGGTLKKEAARGLDKMNSLSMDRNSTSVEDRIRSGKIGQGMTLNPGSMNPYILDALKNKGVEPGFIARHDWSPRDTRSYMSQPGNAALRQEIFALHHPEAAPESMPKDFLADSTELRQAAMKLGERCGSYMALLGEQVIHSALVDQNHPLHGRMTDFMQNAVEETGVSPDTADRLTGFLAGTENASPELLKLAEKLKINAFSDVRQAIMSNSGKLDSRNEIISRFQARVIVKLDYNQSDRISTHGALRKPLRCIQKQGRLYRAFCLHSRSSTNTGAVGEALANDLTRLTGVRTQELSLIRGQYQNGQTKMMLEGKMAEGYQDFDTCLVDGRIVLPDKGQINHLGSYKAGFILMGDRDAIGSRGQNKGFIGHDFFAIDPGHSLEHSSVRLNEDFSLDGASADKFKNFSVFDDTTRADKFQGILRIRDMHLSGSDAKLFNDYKKQFHQDADQKFANGTMKKINSMEEEFTARKLDILNTFDSQLNMYDRMEQTFNSKTIADQAIETEANLSKIVSNTTDVSAHGQVKLRHLEVLHDSREMQFRGKVSPDGQSITFESIAPASTERLDQAEQALQNFAGSSNIRIGRSTDGQHLQVSMQLGSPESISEAFGQFSENTIMAARP